MGQFSSSLAMLTFALFSRSEKAPAQECVGDPKGPHPRLNVCLKLPYSVIYGQVDFCPLFAKRKRSHTRTCRGPEGPHPRSNVCVKLPCSVKFTDWLTFAIFSRSEKALAREERVGTRRAPSTLQCVRKMCVGNLLTGPACKITLVCILQTSDLSHSQT